MTTPVDPQTLSMNALPYNETLVSLLLHMDDRPKACAMPTNTNLHVSVQSKVIEIRTYVCELVIIGFLQHVGKGILILGKKFLWEEIFASCMVFDSLIPRPHPAHISLSISLHTILKVIRTGVGFGSGTKTIGF